MDLAPNVSVLVFSKLICGKLICACKGSSRIRAPDPFSRVIPSHDTNLEEHASKYPFKNYFLKLYLEMFKIFENFTKFDLAVVEFGVISPFTIKYNLCWGTSTYSNAHAKV